MKVQMGELSDFYKITFGNASKNSSADKSVTVSNCHSRMKIFVSYNKGTILVSTYKLNWRYILLMTFSTKCKNSNLFTIWRKIRYMCLGILRLRMNLRLKRFDLFLSQIIFYFMAFGKLKRLFEFTSVKFRQKHLVFSFQSYQMSKFPVSFKKWRFHEIFGVNRFHAATQPF